MQAYISRTFTNVDSAWTATSPLDAICAFCGDKVYSEYEPGNFLTSYINNYYHVNDNTPICDAKL